MLYMTDIRGRRKRLSRLIEAGFGAWCHHPRNIELAGRSDSESMRNVSMDLGNIVMAALTMQEEADRAMEEVPDEVDEFVRRETLELVKE